jgi:hypothetical protein
MILCHKKRGFHRWVVIFDLDLNSWGLPVKVYVVSGMFSLSILCGSIGIYKK